MGALGTRAFIGRRDELAVLDDALQAAGAGRATTVLIGGDAGIGKSSLLTEWNGRARERGARVAIGLALDLGAHGPPYVAVTQALRDLLGALEPGARNQLIGTDRSVLARVIPELAAGPIAGHQAQEGKGTAGQSWQLGQVRLFDRFRDVLDRAAADAPIVLELEDLHWADPSTRAFLVYLAENVTASRLMLIGTYRTEDARPGSGFASTLSQLRRRRGVRLLTLPAFTEPEVHDQLAAILGHAPSNARFKAIVERSEGNALLVEELATAPNPTTDLPASVAEATAARAASLSPDGQAVLRVAAVIGSVVDDHLLRAVAGLDDNKLDGALREAVATRLLVADQAAAGYRFRHALVREAIYQDTLPGERRRLHGAVASALGGAQADVTRDGALAAVVARHWYEAREVERSFQASLVAGAATAGQAAYAESLGHYQRALDLWDRAPVGRSKVTRSAVLTDAAGSAYLVGEFETSLRYAEAAVAELGDTPDPSLQLRALEQLEQARFGVGGDWFEVAAAVGQLEPEGRPPAERIRILEDRAYALRETDQPAALELAREVQALSITNGDPNLIARADGLLADCLWMHDPAASEALNRQALELVVDTGDVFMEADVRRNLGETLMYAHRYEALIEASREGVEFAERRHVGRMARPHFCYQQAWAELQLGRLVDARATIERGLADEPVGHVSWLLHMVGAEAATAMGAFGDAAGHVEAARNPAATAHLEADRPYLGTVRARLALAERRHADVVRLVGAALSNLASRGPVGDELETAWWLAEVGLASAAEQAETGRAAGAAEAVEAAHAFAAQVAEQLDRVRRLRDDAGIPDIGTVTGYERLMEGHQTRLDGCDDPAPWAAAAGAFRPASVEALTARYRQAVAMLSTRASREDIRATLAPAYAAAAAIGARPLADRIAALARRARIDLRASASGVAQSIEEAATVPAAEAGLAEGADGTEALRRRGLSGREIEVLTLVAAGYSNREIGQRLFISTKTASVHVTHILNKLGVSSRIAAATIGIRLGLPEVEADGAGA